MKYLVLVAMAWAGGLSAADSGRTYVLGAGDQVMVRSAIAPELNEKTARVDRAGFVSLPLVGRQAAAGLTVEKLEQALAGKLAEFYTEPLVSVEVIEQRSQPVSVLGAVGKPGIYQLDGRKTLLDLLSLAGGVTSEAGYSIRLVRKKSRGELPTFLKPVDDTGLQVATVNLTELTEARDPRLNIEVEPEDVLSVPRGEFVYVVGEVLRPGGFVLRENESVSVLQAVAMASGFSRMAGPQNARILRTAGPGRERQQITVDLKRVLRGQQPDVPMLADDILVVPNNAPKAASLRALEAAVQMGTGVVIWRR